MGKPNISETELWALRWYAFPVGNRGLTPSPLLPPTLATSVSLLSQKLITSREAAYADLTPAGIALLIRLDGAAAALALPAWGERIETLRAELAAAEHVFALLGTPPAPAPIPPRVPRG